MTYNALNCFVVPTGIEPVSKASETSILSVVLRDQYFPIRLQM